MQKTLQTLLVEREPSAGVTNLLLNNTIGTPGNSMVYRHCKTQVKLQHLPEPYFVSLRKKEAVLATCCFCKREEKGTTLFYVRYFSFDEKFRKRGGQYLESPEKNSVIRNDIHQLLSGSYFGQTSPGNIFYAYLDPQNERSRRLTEEFGFRRVGSFASMVFSRLSPRSVASAGALSANEWAAFKEELTAFYRSHRFFTLENLFYQGNYFVLKEHGEIVAGLQANPEEWRVLEMPGIGGKLLMNVFPRFKPLQKIFSPQYRFLSLEGIYYKSGKERALEKLFEHVLHHFGVYSAVICLDTTSPVYRFAKKLDFGLMGMLKKEKLMDVVVKENGPVISTTGPFYISCFDVT